MHLPPHVSTMKCDKISTTNHNGNRLNWYNACTILFHTRRHLFFVHYKTNTNRSNPKNSLTKSSPTQIIMICMITIASKWQGHTDYKYYYSNTLIISLTQHKKKWVSIILRWPQFFLFNECSQMQGRIIIMRASLFA